MGAFSLSERRIELLRFASDMPAVPTRGAGPPLLQDGVVLALTDSTPDGVNAAWRAALVARDRGAPLHLLCTESHAGERTPDDRCAVGLARRIRGHLHVAASADCGRGALRERLVPWVGRAQLLVLPWMRSNLLTDLVCGSLAERLFRSLFLPMLVVRRPALGSYRRVLVPVKLDSGAVILVRTARTISRGPCIQVLHVLDTWQESALRLANASEPVVRFQRQQCSRHAYSALHEIIRSAGARGDGAAAVVSFGHVVARLLAAARAGNAQLIVTGKERRSLLAELLLPSCTPRVLFESSADVLVLPVPGEKETLNPSRRKGMY